MSLKNGIKKVGKWIGDKQREHAESIRKRKELLNELTMPKLKKFSKDYNIEINWYFYDKPRFKDYVYSIANSYVDTEKIENFVKKEKRKEEIELEGTKPLKITETHFHNKADIKLDHGSSFAGDVTNIDITINDFKDAIINSNLDSDLIVQSLKYIEQLKNEIKKPDRDRTGIQKIIDWFKNNKEELVIIATPFIQKIVSYL